MFAFFVFVFYLIKISKLALPGVMLKYERKKEMYYRLSQVYCIKSVLRKNPLVQKGLSWHVALLNDMMTLNQQDECYNLQFEE